MSSTSRNSCAKDFSPAGPDTWNTGFLIPSGLVQVEAGAVEPDHYEGKCLGQKYIDSASSTTVGSQSTSTLLNVSQSSVHSYSSCATSARRKDSLASLEAPFSSISTAASSPASHSRSKCSSITTSPTVSPSRRNSAFRRSGHREAGGMPDLAQQFCVSSPSSANGQRGGGYSCSGIAKLEKDSTEELLLSTLQSPEHGTSIPLTSAWPSGEQLCTFQWRDLPIHIHHQAHSQERVRRQSSRASRLLQVVDVSSEDSDH